MRLERNGERARRAAVLYLDQRIAVANLTERFGLSKDRIYDAVRKLRGERGGPLPKRGAPGALYR